MKQYTFKALLISLFVGLIVLIICVSIFGAMFSNLTFIDAFHSISITSISSLISLFTGIKTFIEFEDYFIQTQDNGINYHYNTSRKI